MSGVKIEHADLQFYGFGITEDGKAVQMQFHKPTDPPDKLVLLTLPTGTIPAIFAAMGGLIDSLILAQALPPDKNSRPIRQAASWLVGENSLAPNYTALLFDEGLTQESMVLMPDLAALQMADAIQQKIFGGMSLNDQKKLMTEVERNRGPNGGRTTKPLIMPPRKPLKK